LLDAYRNEMASHAQLTALGTKSSGLTNERKRKIRQYKIEEKPSKKLKQIRYKKAKANNAVKKYVEIRVQEVGGYEYIMTHGLMKRVAKLVAQDCANDPIAQKYQKTFKSSDGGNAVKEIYAHHNSIDLGLYCNRTRILSRRIGKYQLSVPKERIHRDVCNLYLY
jgi:hypothetical protein